MTFQKFLFSIASILLLACSADYDTFGTSDYRNLNEITLVEQENSPAIYANEHRIEFDLQTPPDSIKTWDSVTIEEIDISHFAKLHLVKTKVDEFPKDSLELDSLAEEVFFVDDVLEEGDKIKIPASHIVYVIVVSESKKKSIWKIEFNIPNVEPTDDDAKSSSSKEKSSASSSTSKSSSSAAKSSSSMEKSSSSVDPDAAPAPEILSLSIAGKLAQIDADSKHIHVDSLTFRSDLSSLELSEMTLSDGAKANVTVGESYDFGYGVDITVTNTDGVEETYFVKAGYQLPGENFNIWDGNNVKPDSVWGNANTLITTTKKTTSGSMIGAQIQTETFFGKVASGSLYTADFNPNGVGLTSMASSSTWPDGNELLDFGKRFEARPEYMEVKFSYDGKGDSCDIYILLENRTGDKNINRKATDENKLVASAWYRSTKADNSGRENPDVVNVSELDENGMRTLRLKLQYGSPIEGSPIENSSTFNTTLRSSDKKAVNNGLVQGTGEEAVTHIRVVFASSAAGNLYQGTSGAKLVIDEMRLVY